LAAAMGAKTNKANATVNTSKTDLRISYLLGLVCTSTERMHHPGSCDLCKFMDLF
jgi:hypothetical protein